MDVSRIARSRAPQRLIARSLRAKLLVTLLPVVAVAVAVLTLVAVQRAGDAQRETVYAQAADLAAREANAFDAEARAHLATAVSLASVAAREDDRRRMNEIVRGFALDNPQAVGAFLAFARDAFDGPDAAHRGAPGTTADGHFAPYWNRLGGTLANTPTVDEQMPIFAALRERRAPTVAEPFVFDGKLITSYGAPVLRDGRFHGISTLDVTLADLDAAVSRVRFLDSGYAFVVSRDGQFVSHPDKRLIGRATLAEQARRTGEPAYARIAAAIRAGRRVRVEATDPRTGEEVVMFTAPVATGGWGFVTVAPADEVLAAARSLRTTLLLLGLVVLLVAGTVVWWTAARLTRPVAAVAAAADRIARGDLSVEVRARTSDELGRMARAFGGMVAYLRELASTADAMAAGDLSRTVEPKSEQDVLGRAFARMSGELREALGDRSCLEQLVDRMEQLRAADLAQLDDGLRAMSGGDLTRPAAATVEPIATAAGARPGRLAEIFDEMLASSRRSIAGYEAMRGSLGSMLGELGDASAAVSSTSRQMASTSEEVGRAVGEVSSAIADVALGAERQVSTVGSARRSGEEVAGAVERSGATARDAADSAERARALAADGADAVSRAGEALAAIRHSATAATDAIGSLGAHSSEIGGIVATITGIAEQTNLLALNAAIEAARAGEQGRGFAVVAEEVRKLAEEAQQAAASIGGLIGEMQRDTGRAIEVVQASSERTDAGVATVAEAHEAFTRIAASIDAIGGRVGEIAAAVEQIGAGSAQLIDDIGAVAAVAEQASASTQEISAATQQTSASTEQIAASAHELATTAAELDRLAQRFVVA